MALTFPSSIAAANVLGGIADTVAIVRCSQADNAAVVETIQFDTGQFRPPPAIKYSPEVDRLIKYRSGKLDYRFKWRARFIFQLPYLDAAEAAKWTKLYNYHLGGFHILMRPHNDNGLSLERQVCPTPGVDYELGYFAEMFIGHKATFDWTSVNTQSDLNLKTSQLRGRPVRS